MKRLVLQDQFQLQWCLAWVFGASHLRKLLRTSAKMLSSPRLQADVNPPPHHPPLQHSCYKGLPVLNGSHRVSDRPSLTFPAIPTQLALNNGLCHF